MKSFGSFLKVIQDTGFVPEDFFKKTSKQTIKINTSNFNYGKILFSQNFCFAKNKSVYSKCEKISPN